MGTKWHNHQTREEGALVGEQGLKRSNGKISGTSWMANREQNLKYLEAQQVSQQILCVYFKSKFHNEWGDWEKS